MTTLRLMVACAIIVAGGLATSAAQDWIPFHVAAGLASRGLWPSIYPPNSAQSLFDVTTDYREEARRSVQHDGAPAFLDSTLTSFVSPPPAALALQPFTKSAWRTSVTVWRLALAIPMVLALLWFAASAGDPAAAGRWSWLCLAGAPLASYVVQSGQPSGWLMVAAAMSVLPATAPRDAAGGLALGLGVVFKATPLLVIAGLWLAGRRRLALIAAAVAASAVIGSLPLTGVESWTRFSAVSARLASVVITDWNNAAIDAALLRPVAGVDAVFHKPTTLTFVVSQLSRLLLLIACLAVAGRPAVEPARRAAAAWIAWMAVTPILWLHYLLLLVPLFGAQPGRKSGAGLVLVGLLSAAFLARVAGWQSGTHGYVLGAVWLASALWLLSNRSLAKKWLSRS